MTEPATKLDPAAAPGNLAEMTLDLAAIAGLAPGDQVRIQGINNSTLDLFERTFELLSSGEFAPGDDTIPPAPLPGGSSAAPEIRYLPQHDDLRARFKFAEVLGSYGTLNSLLDRFAPVIELSETMVRTSRVGELSVQEVAMLEDYREQVRLALEHASAHLAVSSIAEFTSEELGELNDILNEARRRYHELDTVLGMRLIHDVEKAVQRLRQICEKVASVERSLTGIFLVESEIMFVPSAELIKLVDDIFKAIGNPFVVDNIDGTLLLAARNLLIQVVCFYAYYGREQIYQLCGGNQGKTGRSKVATYIRDEIRVLFSACKANNKLVLTRVMSNTEREFEISVEAIQTEAARQAITEVNRLMPARPVIPKPPARSLLARLAGWLFRDA